MLYYKPDIIAAKIKEAYGLTEEVYREHLCHLGKGSPEVWEDVFEYFWYPQINEHYSYLQRQMFYNRGALPVIFYLEKDVVHWILVAFSKVASLFSEEFLSAGLQYLFIRIYANNYSEIPVTLPMLIQFFTKLSLSMNGNILKIAEKQFPETLKGLRSMYMDSQILYSDSVLKYFLKQNMRLVKNVGELNYKNEEAILHEKNISKKPIILVPSELYVGKRPSEVYAIMRDKGFADAIIAYILCEQCNCNQTTVGRFFATKSNQDASSHAKRARKLLKGAQNYIIQNS